MHPFYEYILEHAGLETILMQKHISIPTPAEKEAVTPELDHLKAQVHQCTRCPLHAGKTNYVFGEGNPHAQLMFIGEGPGQDEDLSGRPFVGRAGQLLTKIISAMKLERKDVYIANIVKCRPPNNRAPLPEEAHTCMPYLKTQIKLIAPKIIVLLGATATSYMLGQKVPISKIRGQWTELTLDTGDNATHFKTMPTFHPAALLRNPNLKKDVWEDMKQVMGALGLPI